MEEVLKRKIKKIISENRCPNDLECYKSGFARVSKVRYKRPELYLECLEKDSQKCKLSLHRGNRFFCQCPIRVYIFKVLKK